MNKAESNVLREQSVNQAAWVDETTLRSLLESAPIAMVMVSQIGEILYVNEKLMELFAYRRDELMGQQLELLLPEYLRQHHVEHRVDYVENPHTRPMGSGMNLVGRRKGGSEVPIEAGLSFVHAQQGMLILCSVTDITLRKQTEEMLEQRVEQRTREIERRRQVADSLRDILAMLNSNQLLANALSYIVEQTGRLLDTDASAVFLLNPESQSFEIEVSDRLEVGTVVDAQIPLDDESLLYQTILTRSPIPICDLAQEHLYQVKHLHDSNQTPNRKYRALLAIPLLIEDEVYGTLVLYYRNARSFNQEEVELAMTLGHQTSLAIQNARLRTQIEETAVVAERNRIARNLHDSVTQTLFSSTMLSDILPQLWEINPDEGKKRLAQMHQLNRGALAEMRTLLHELRPETLADVELEELFQHLTEAISARAQAEVTLHIEGDIDLPAEVREAFYRIAQEALNNVARHAEASQATLTLRCGPRQAFLSISDDGQGFKVDDTRPTHLGLDIMHERSEAIGAILDIQSQIDQGTQVQVIWNRPLSAQQANTK